MVAALNGGYNVNIGVSLAIKNKTWEEVHFVYNELTDEAADALSGVGRVVCKACAPNWANLKCDICSKTKVALEFPKDEQNEPLKTFQHYWACF